MRRLKKIALIIPKFSFKLHSNGPKLFQIGQSVKYIKKRIYRHRNIYFFCKLVWTKIYSCLNSTKDISTCTQNKSVCSNIKKFDLFIVCKGTLNFFFILQCPLEVLILLIKALRCNSFHLINIYRNAFEIQFPTYSYLQNGEHRTARSKASSGI